MQLNKINFRDLERKWIVFSKGKEIRKIYKKLKLDYEEGIVLAYTFISHENGIQIRILGNIVSEEGILHLEDELVEKNLFFSFEEALKYSITVMDNSVIQKISGTGDIEKEILKNEERNSILEARKITEIDTFRHEQYVDDVELLYEGKKKDEYLWARIEDCSKKNLLFVCSLLEPSKQNKNYKEGVLVLAKIVKEKKNTKFVIDGIVDKVQKQ